MLVKYNETIRKEMLAAKPIKVAVELGWYYSIGFNLSKSTFTLEQMGVNA